MKKSLNLEEIKEIIPHRDPFLLIDKVVELNFEEGYVIAEKKITGDEYFFKGHFPERPIMPGVLVLESIAQAGACYILSLEEYRNKIAVFAKANNVKWKNMVLPGDTLTLKIKLDRIKAGVAISKGAAYVGDKLVCEAEIVSALAK